MLDSADKSYLEECHRQNLIIWAALLMSLVIYLVVGLIVSPEKSRGQDMVFPIVLILLGVFLLALSTVFFRKSATLGKDRPPEGTDPFKWLAIRYRKGLLLALALSETVGLYGLVLYFIGYGNLYLFCMVGVAFVAQIMFRPNHDVLEDQFIALKKEILT